MKLQYIKQIDNQNFLYPNNTLAEYDVNIIHELLENPPLATTTVPTLTSNAGNIDVSVDYTWDLNGAEPFIDNYNKLNMIYVTFQTPDRPYFTNWMNVYIVQTDDITTTSTGGTLNFTITPQMVGQTSFSTNGYYSITFQGISRRALNGGSGWYYYFGPTPPTPTPTSTPSITPTPTNTPGLPPSTPTPTPSATPTGGDCTATSWRILNTTGSSVIWSGFDCNGNSVGGVVYNGQTIVTGCVADGTFTYSGSPTVTVAGYC